MIHSEKGKVTFCLPKEELKAEAEAYADLASIFYAIKHEFGLSTLLTFLEYYTSKELNIDGSRN